eukprot:CAMPEP_0174741370 /NCGR_PEP_ID=MMETSP1094-20130205/76131_1 /TAXON_ID=156173 /ORGANISM="Chrysochromulina brevifilum, Strain UTEX LB 985" /LENGTH=48 /DNA_ID= /DNA_START= /DNA_END= /DNA_ORIENTATION=
MSHEGAPCRECHRAATAKGPDDSASDKTFDTAPQQSLLRSDRRFKWLA